MTESEKFEGWAVVEMLGHKQLAGRVSEQVVAGAALVRVDVPETQQRKYVEGYGGYVVEAKPGYTKIIGVGSIYCITPCDEETARRAAQVLEQYNSPLPVTLPKQLAAPVASTPAVDGVAPADFELVSEDEEEEEDDDEPF